MKIGIDARMLGSGYGIGRYIQQLILNLEEIDDENQYILFLRKENWAEFEPKKTNFKKVLADIPWYSLSEQIKFSKIICKEKIDIMHFPHFNVPLFYNNPFVLTIHDLTMFHFPRPEATTRGRLFFYLKDKAHRLIIKSAVKRARKIFVTSQFTLEDVHKTLRAPKEKMVVVYQAPFQILNFIPTESGQISNFTLEKFCINKPYALYVGAAYPHKNLELLIKAWGSFEQKNGLNYQLVLAGKRNYFYNRLLNNLNEDQLKSIIFVDFPSDEELAFLYQNAKLFVFPSLYEGFGIPPLEAMNYGVPVISSNSSCLPEVLGDGAMYFDPENIEQMADVINLVLNDENIRFDLKNNAKEILANYSNLQLAKITKMVYEKVS